MEGNPDERFAEWYVWAKREVGSDDRVCLGVAQAALAAEEAGADEATARQAGRRSTAGHGIALMAQVTPRRRAYAEWYDWSRREIGGGAERQHTATRAAIACLDRGGDAAEAATLARQAVGDMAPAPPPSAVPTPPAPLPAPVQPPEQAWQTPASVAAPVPAPSPTPTPAPVAPPAAPAAPSWQAAASPPSPAPAPYAPPPYPYAVAAPLLLYGGFWRRALGFVIDQVLLTVAFLIVWFIAAIVLGISFAVSGQALTDQVGVGITVGLLFVFFILWWLYYAGLEHSAWQATIGKRIVGVAVGDAVGQRIGFGRATGRYFAKIAIPIVGYVILVLIGSVLPLIIWVALVLVASVPLLAGFWIAPMTRRKQALHDLIAGTVVVRRQQQQPSLVTQT